MHSIVLYMNLFLLLGVNYRVISRFRLFTSHRAKLVLWKSHLVCKGQNSFQQGENSQETILKKPLQQDTSLFWPLRTRSFWETMWNHDFTQSHFFYYLGTGPNLGDFSQLLIYLQKHYTHQPACCYILQKLFAMLNIIYIHL